MRSIQAISLSGCLACGGVAAAPPLDGRLDPAFDSDGRVVLSFDKGGTQSDTTTAVVTTNDATYVFGDVSRPNGVVVSTITRLKADGSMDSAGYGDQGTVYVDMFDGYYDDYGLERGALQADGKLIAVGRAANAEDADVLVCRFESNGEPDIDFGGDAGCRRIPIDLDGDGNGDDFADDVAIRADQQIVVAATAYGASIPQGHLIQLDANGTLDTDFGDGGTGIASVPQLLNSTGTRIRIRNSGRIVIASNRKGGFLCLEAESSFIVVSQFLASGIEDMAFAGKSVNFDFGFDFENNFPVDCSVTEDRLTGIDLAADGSILLGARAEITPNHFVAAITRLKSDGSWDPDFGMPAGERAVDGQTAALVSACQFCSPAFFTGFALLPDGRMITSGHTVVPNAPNGTTDTLAIRLLPDGSVDADFGEGLFGEAGRMAVSFDAGPSGNVDYASAIALQNGLPLVVGWTRPFGSPNNDFALFRLGNDRIFANDLEK